MEKRRLGRTDLQVSVLGFGGAEIGLQGLSKAQAGPLLNAALDAGINVIDTAECYQESEELIGDVIGHRRDEYFIFTKCGHAISEDEGHWEKQTIISGIERSLKRLKRDCVDLIQLHSCPMELLQRGEVIEILEKARADGKTRFIGCSADGRAASFAVETGRFDVLQTSFSIADQEALRVNFPLVRKHDMGVIVKRPIANAVWKHTTKPENPWLHKYWDRIRALDYAFLRDGGRDAFATAMAFALAPPEVSTAIVGTTNPAHLAANVRALMASTPDTAVFTDIRERWQACGGDEWPGVG